MLGGRSALLVYIGVALIFCACVTKSPPNLLKLERFVQPDTRGNTGQIYSDPDQAAIAACEWLWKNVPEAKQWEFGGCIYSNDKGIWAGLPETLQKPGWCVIPKEPTGSRLLGKYHNHLVTEEFSKDVDMPTSSDIPQYLCTPKGGVLKYTRSGGTVRLK